MRKYSSCILIICLLLSFNAVVAQQYNFKNYTIDAGLPQNDVYTIVQDARGYLWMGTNGGGVSIFDGKSFKNLNKKDGLVGNVVRCIIEDKKGNIWIGTDEGVSIYNGFSFSNVDENSGLSSNLVVKVFEDSKGRIWACTSTGGLNQIDLNEDGALQVVVYNADNVLTSNAVFDIAEDNYGRLWLATFREGIDIITFDKDTFSVRNVRKFDIPSNLLPSVSKDENGTLWFGSYEGGVFTIATQGPDSGKVTLTGINHAAIWDIQHDKEGNVWIGTNDEGLIRYDGKRKQYFNVNNGISNNQILSIYQDREGNIWAGSMGNGVSMFMGEEFIHFTEKEGISQNQIFDINEDKEGNFWLASYGGGLIKLIYQVDSVGIVSYTMEDGLPSNTIKSITIDSKDIFWLATAESGVAKWNGKDFTTYVTEDGLINDEVRTIYADSKDIIWIGTIGGISMYDGRVFINVDEADWGLIDNEVQTIIEDIDGNMWVGTYNGLAKIHDSLMTSFDEVEGLYDKKINALTEDKHGNIWIGTFGGGLYRHDKNSTDSLPIKFVADDKVLGSNNIYSLIFLEENILLVGTDKGFDKVFLNKELGVAMVKTYDFSCGFTGVENKDNAIFKDKEGCVWFGTVKGVTRYNPSLEVVNKQPPILHITGMKLFFEKVDWTTRSDNILPWSNLPAELELNYDENHISFEFSGISYSNPEKVLYRFKLEGLEEEWSPPRKENEAVYSGLPAGEYTFKVIAVNENNAWSTMPASYSFVIHPPFWKTTWFISLCVLLTILLVFVYIKWRERKLQRDKAILEQTVKERTAEVVKQKDEIEHHRDHIAEQQKEIMDSIRYAKRIQTAILPPEDHVTKSLPEHFILFKPKDIVSGDFHWTAVKDNKLIITGADCTGHGVPGAFMSMLGISFLNQIVNERGVTQPAKILDQLRINIIKSLQQTGESGEQKDGMDIALCTIDLESKKVEFAGANNPLYLIRNGELIETKADKMPVAIFVVMDPFTNHEFDGLPGDTFYLFSDGFADQFGGPLGKKYKYKPFKSILLEIQDKSMNEQKRILDKTIEDWKGFSDDDGNTYEQVDDIVVVGIRL